MILRRLLWTFLGKSWLLHTPVCLLRSHDCPSGSSLWRFDGILAICHRLSCCHFAYHHIYYGFLLFILYSSVFNYVPSSFCSNKYSVLPLSVPHQAEMWCHLRRAYPRQQQPVACWPGKWCPRMERLFVNVWKRTAEQVFCLTKSFRSAVFVSMANPFLHFTYSLNLSLDRWNWLRRKSRLCQSLWRC